MSGSAGIDNELQEIIAEYIDSVELLKILLLLNRRALESLTAFTLIVFAVLESNRIKETRH